MQENLSRLFVYTSNIAQCQKGFVICKICITHMTDSKVTYKLKQ